MQSFREQKVIIFYLSNKRAKENGFKAVKISDISKEAFPNNRKKVKHGYEGRLGIHFVSVTRTSCLSSSGNKIRSCYLEESNKYGSKYHLLGLPWWSSG